MVLNVIMKLFKQSGFTILELIIAVAVIGIVSTIGIPTFKAMGIINEVADTSNAMRMAMKYTRGEALARGKSVIMCSSTDGSTCSLADGKWAKGWIIGVDINNDATISEADDQLLSVHLLDAKTQITILPSNPAFNQKVIYGYDGWLEAGVAAGFNICTGYPTDGYAQREIRASVAGEPQLAKSASVKC